MSAFFIIVPDFVKVILVELPNETGEVAMLEVFGENRLGEMFILGRSAGGGCMLLDSAPNLEHDKAFPVIAPSDYLRIRRVF